MTITNVRAKARVAIFALLGAIAVLAVKPVVAGPLDAPLPGQAYIVQTPRDIRSGSTTDVTVAVLGLGATPINWLSVTPAKAVSIVSGATLKSLSGYFTTGWKPTLSGSRITFAGGAILPGETATFTLKVLGAASNGALSAADTLAPLRVEASTDGGAHKRLMTPPAEDPNGLTLTVRVLEIVSGLKVAAPAAASDGTVTAGQDNLVVGATVKNIGGGALSPTAVLTATNGTVATPSVPLTLQPGQSAALAYNVIAGNSAAPMDLALKVTSASPAAQIGSIATPVTVQAVPAISCTSVRATGSDSIFNPAYEVVFGKTGVQSLDVASYALRIQTTPVHGPAAILSKTIAAGDQAGLKLVFGSVAVPAGIPEGEYGTVLGVTAVDSNGAMLAVKDIACPKVRVDTLAPSLSSAKIAAVSNPLQPLRLAPDATINITFSEVLGGGADFADDWIAVGSNGNAVDGVTIAGVEPCANATDSCRTLSVDSGLSNAWQSIVSIVYCPQVAANSYRDVVGNKTLCGAAASVTA